MTRAICGFGLIMLMASLASAQSVESRVLVQPQPAYGDYVRLVEKSKEVRTGKSTIFTYAQWVQYCRGEFTGQIVKTGRGRDRSCRNFINPPFDFAAKTDSAAAPNWNFAEVQTELARRQRVMDQANEPFASQQPANWNFMNAQEQARWFNEQQRLRVCNSSPTAAGCMTTDAEAARQFNERQAQRVQPVFPPNWNLMNAWEQAQWSCAQGNTAQCNVARGMERRTPIAVPNLFPAPRPAPPAVTFGAPTTSTCGRACGEPWTAEDFAAVDAEIVRLEQELARLRQGAAQPTDTAPIYTPPPPNYTPYRYTPPTPSYSAPSYESNSGSTYDAKSGNRYSWYQDLLGTTHVRGSNLTTGSMWRSTIDKDGYQRGTDKDGNSWRYNPDTGSYINYGTGEMCFGRGYARTCTGGSR